MGVRFMETHMLFGLGAFLWAMCGIQGWRNVVRNIPYAELNPYDYVMLPVCMLGGPLIWAMSKIEV